MIKKGSFIIHLFVMHEILLIINILSNQFQEKNSTLGKASNLVKSVITTLENKRNDKEFNILWKQIKEFCENYDISIYMNSEGIK